MKAAGVIVEFNPLHNGHVEHLRETKRLTQRDKIIAVMSGNFVQRGEPALCDKWLRARMALQAGVDIVIELPVPYVISGADYFARGSVKLLAATGVVDALCFGSESGDLALIKEAAQILALEPNEYKTALRDGLSKGLSFAAARGMALNAMLSLAHGDVPEGLLTKPNNGLGMEYCKALCLMGWPMDVYTSYRASGGPSATAIRKAVSDSKTVKALPLYIQETLPPYVQELLQKAIKAKEIARLDDYSEIFRYLLFTKELNLGEGLENRFRHYANKHLRLTELLDAVKTKRYTYTRLQRAVLSIVLGISLSDMTAYESIGGPQYIRVLGFRQDAAGLLGEMTRKASLPVLTHGKAKVQLEGPAAAMLAKEQEVGDIYKLAFGKPGEYRHERKAPIITSI